MPTGSKETVINKLYHYHTLCGLLCWLLSHTPTRFFFNTPETLDLEKEVRVPAGENLITLWATPWVYDGCVGLSTEGAI